MKSLSGVGSGRPLVGIALILITSILTIVGINGGVSMLRVRGVLLPEYGLWTGIAPFEQKLRLLREFASRGPVDALIVGSSLSDHGVSAAVLSRDLSAAYGRPFRVFNLSTGGAEIDTFPILYRLARAVAKPRQIWIVFPVEQRGRDDHDSNPRGPNYALLRSPAAAALRYPLLLSLSFRLFQIPVVRNAAALRDLGIYGHFVNRPPSLMDFYDENAFGDTRGFLSYSLTEPFAKYVGLRRETVLSLAGQYAAAPDEGAKTGIYFSRGDLHAIADIRAMAARDHCSIRIFAYDTAAGFATQDRAYHAASELYYKLLSARFDAPVIDVRASFHLAGYKFADMVHLNSNGADEISAFMAAGLANRPLLRSSDYAVAREPNPDLPLAGMTPYTAVVLRRPRDPQAELQLRYVQSVSVVPLTPGSLIQLAVLLPDHSTRAVSASVVSRGVVIADTSALPREAGGEALFVQLTGIHEKWGEGRSMPLASYRWSIATGLHQTFPEASAKVFVGAASYTSLDRIRAFWTKIDHPGRKDWVGIFPVGGGDQTRLSMNWTGGGASGALDVHLNPAPVPGQYELRYFADGSSNLMAYSKPFAIVSPGAPRLKQNSRDRYPNAETSQSVSRRLFGAPL
jgi:hypothetical protein